MRLPLFLIVVLAALCIGVAVPAQPPPPLSALEADLEAMAPETNDPAEPLQVSDVDRQRLRALVEDAISRRQAAQAEAEKIGRLLEELGPKPEDTEKPEEAVIATRRAELTAEQARFEAEAKQAGLIAARGEQVLAELSRTERQELQETLFEHRRSPLDSDLWMTAWRDFSIAFRETFIDEPAAWWVSLRGDAKKQIELSQLVVLAVLAALIAWPIRRWLNRRFHRSPEADSPGASRRLVAALGKALANGIIPVAFWIFIGVSLDERNLIDGAMGTAVVALVRGIILFLLVSSLIDSALSPAAPQWRLIALEPGAARVLVRRAKLALVLFLVSEGLFRALSWVTPSEEFDVAHSTLNALILAPAIFAVLSRRIWDNLEGEGMPTPLFTRLRTLLSAAVILSPLIALAGYGALANYILRVLVLTAITFGILWFLRTMLREAVGSLLESDAAPARSLRAALALDAAGARRLKFWLYLLADIGLTVLAVVMMVPVLGLQRGIVADTAARLMTGVEIGSYVFSLADLLLALALFAGILVVTRLLQKSLADHVLPNLTADKGIADALKTGVGYLGVLIAVLIGVSAVGIDLTNLALIAGALSVGIGFGLQNIVNNFVSGIILLIERPIKPGDWVVIGDREGTVKKVNVRSTEIDTFQRASLIIPNADLISQPVLNWTHKSSLGRVEVVVGVAYGSDVQKVREILLACAHEHANVFSYPQPFVLFQDFGDSALIFELRAYLRNVENRLSTASDLRFAIYARLEEAGIEIPFPQRVVHMADKKSARPDGEPGGGMTDPL